MQAEWVCRQREEMKIELLAVFWPGKPSQEAVDGLPRDSEWQVCHSGKNKMDWTPTWYPAWL